MSTVKGFLHIDYCMLSEGLKVTVKGDFDGETLVIALSKPELKHCVDALSKIFDMARKVSEQLEKEQVKQ